MLILLAPGARKNQGVGSASLTQRDKRRAASRIEPLTKKNVHSRAPLRLNLMVTICQIATELRKHTYIPVGAGGKATRNGGRFFNIIYLKF